MFIRKLALSAVSIAFVTACGGSGDTPPAQSEKPVKVQGVIEGASSPSTTETATPEAITPEAPAEIEVVNEFAGLPAPYNTADYARGKRVFKQCSSCHLVDEGAGHLVGPNLHGLFSRTSGGLDDFTYSKALEEADFAWTPEKVNEWLTDPKGFLEGNRMSFAGVRKEEDRLAVVAYLMLKTGDNPGDE